MYAVTVYMTPAYRICKCTRVEVSPREGREKKGQGGAGRAGQLCRILGYTVLVMSWKGGVET